MGSLGVLFFIFSIINNFSYKLILFPRLAIVGFSIIIGSKIIQLGLEPTSTIYGIQLVNEDLIRVNPIFFSLIIVLTYLSLYISLILFIRNQNLLPSYIVPDKIKQYSINALVIMTVGMLFQTIGTLMVKDANTAGWILILSRMCITSGFIFIVLQFTKNPVLSFSEKGNPAQFIVNGTINWLLLGNRNLGPEALRTSPTLKNLFTIEELQLFSVKLLTSVTLGKEEHGEEMCIIPHSNSEKEINLVAIGFSFLHHDPSLTDPRKKGLIELVFAIVIPQILLPYLQNLNLTAMKDPIMKIVEETSNIEEFMKKTRFDSLTAILLRNLTQKKAF